MAIFQFGPWWHRNLNSGMHPSFPNRPFKVPSGSASDSMNLKSNLTAHMFCHDAQKADDVSLSVLCHVIRFDSFLPRRYYKLKRGKKSYISHYQSSFLKKMFPWGDFAFLCYTLMTQEWMRPDMNMVNITACCIRYIDLTASRLAWSGVDTSSSQDICWCAADTMQPVLTMLIFSGGQTLSELAGSNFTPCKQEKQSAAHSTPEGNFLLLN